jgi:hypothetical protein
MRTHRKSNGALTSMIGSVELSYKITARGGLETIAKTVEPGAVLLACS